MQHAFLVWCQPLYRLVVFDRSITKIYTPYHIRLSMWIECKYCHASFSATSNWPYGSSYFLFFWFDLEPSVKKLLVVNVFGSKTFVLSEGKFLLSRTSLLHFYAYRSLEKQNMAKKRVTWHTDMLHFNWFGVKSKWRTCSSTSPDNYSTGAFIMKLNLLVNRKFDFLWDYFHKCLLLCKVH